MRKKTKAKTRPKPKASGHSKFWPGLFLGGVIAVVAVHFGPGWLGDPPAVKEEPGGSAAFAKSSKAGSPKENRTAPVKSKTSSQTPAPTAAKSAAVSPAPSPIIPHRPGGLPFFRDPARAANLLARLDMGESYPGSLLWKKGDTLGWNAFGVLAIAGPSVSTTGPGGNTVTCLLESKRADRVEALRLTANVFSPRAAEATLSKFKSLAGTVLQETRCPATRQFLDAIDGTLGLQTESPEGRFTLAPSPLAPGTRWELVVESR